MPPLTPAEHVDAQRQDWNRVASGWEKWDELFDRQMTFMNHRLVGDARLRPGLQVLDLGSGTGYPAVLDAQVVGPQGAVIGMDLAEHMLAAAARKAARLGLTNLSFRTGDVTTLPFDANAFDAVTSRFCLMFLPEVSKGAAEIARVLKPGGWVATAVWSAPEKNPSLSLAMDILKELLDVPPPDPAAPGIFRLAQAGALAGLLEAAGLVDVADQEFAAEWSYASADEYVTSLMEIAAPLQKLFAKLSPGQAAEVRRRILEAAGRYRRGAAVTFPIAVRIVAARKP